ncbi:MAG: peptide chain release factor N(5)-glutamine methyltransferase [Bacteroidaceae bacterium]|nr:peptide chain release factor N(5)-glutamine methyltransferase [Bacteroidaceae bacterium]
MQYTNIFHTLKKELQSSYSQREAETIAFWLLEDVAGLTRSDVLMGRADLLSDELIGRLQQMVRRIAQGEPVQYVLGYTDFCNLRIGVAPGVLIPRPETADMVEMCRQFAPTHIYDLCTGSGCIALALKKMFPKATVEGWDISDKALDIARQNAEDLELDVTFRHVDVLDGSSPPVGMSRRGIGLLISNPPYVCDSERAEMERNVLEHEPAEALFVPDDDPLLFYRAIATWGHYLLSDGGHVMVETNRRYAHDVADLFRSKGYDEAEVLKDCFSNDRMVQCQKISTAVVQ